MSSIEELETRAGCKVTRTKKYKEADEADIGALFPEVMKNCGDKLAEYMCDDRQKIAALAATCVGASDASKSWRLLGHADSRLEDVAMRITQVDFPLFVEERDAYSLRWLALAAKGDAHAKMIVTKLHLGHQHCACEATQVFVPSCAESPEKCLELCRDLFGTLGATTENVYGEHVGYVHPGLLELLAGDAFPSRNKTSPKLAYPHVAWAKEAADRNAFAKEVNTADVASERLEQFRVSYDTPLRSLVKVLAVAWNNGEHTIIGCVGVKRILALLHAHCGLFKAHREAIDLSSVEAFKKTYPTILVRTIDKDDTLRYGSAEEASTEFLLLGAGVAAKNSADYKAGNDEALDPKLVNCKGFPDCHRAITFWQLQCRLRKLLATPNAVPGALRAHVEAYCQLEIKWTTSSVGGVIARPLLDLKNSSNYEEITTTGTRKTPSRVIRAADPVGIASADFIQCQYLLSNVDAYSVALPLALRAAAYLKEASNGRHNITKGKLKAYIAERQRDADRAKFLFEREDILGRSPRLRLAALLRFSSCLSIPRLEDVVDDVACLKRTWHKSRPDSSDLIAEVQAQLRAALAELPESDPPDPDCPVGAHVKYVSEDKTELGYIVECSDDMYYIVFDVGGLDEDWYECADDGLTVLGL